MAELAHGTSTRHDFDFWIGTWQQHHRRLRERLAGCEEWDEFESTSVAWPILDGLGNVDELRTDWGGGLVGASIRFFDAATRTWSIYWVDTRRSGPLEPPVIGSFSGDVGVFECPDTFEGRPILVRYTWSRTSTPTPHWEQAFSTDEGQTWETNWITDSTRVDPSRGDRP
jgi:hypothetical protein